MASILKVDDLRGNTAAGNITITGEGGAATMQLQKGVAKAWAKVTQSTSHTLNSSFNISSIVDGGTGETDLLFTSNMNDANYVIAKAEYGSNNRRSIAETVQTSQTTIQTFQVSSNSTAVDATNGVANMIMGDLA